MSESLFQPMYLVWVSIIVLMIMWSREAWRHWWGTRQGYKDFRKAILPVPHRYIKWFKKHQHVAR